MPLSEEITEEVTVSDVDVPLSGFDVADSTVVGSVTVGSVTVGSVVAGLIAGISSVSRTVPHTVHSLC